MSLLVIDFNQILFDDHELAIDIANEAARRGIIVGIYSYDLESRKLRRLVRRPHVLTAKTHRRLLHDIFSDARLHARPVATAAKALKGMGNTVGD